MNISHQDMTYEQLKVERDRLKSLLEHNKQLRNHGSYKLVEQELDNVRKEINRRFKK